MNVIPARQDLSAAQGRLARWLLKEAFPHWSEQGWDALHGGFYERLTATGPVAGDARRARVQLRQIYCFARAPLLGWQGGAQRLVRDGLAHYRAHYLRPDGLTRTLVAADGSVADDRAVLYDQAFALLALSEVHRLLGAECKAREAAEALLARIRAAFARPGWGLRSVEGSERVLSSNPHMHLLEAALAWQGLSEDPRWQHLAEEIIGWSLEHMIDVGSGVLREHFELCGATAGIAGRLVEPGHQFEWAWLLLSSGLTSGPVSVEKIPAARFEAARRLIDIGETYGIRAGVAINSLLDDMSVHEPEARLWPQTERLKAHALMARLTGEPRHLHLAVEAAEALERYLQTGSRGLWYDRLLPDGRFVAEPAPASSFYHIVCAIAELSAAVASAS